MRHITDNQTGIETQYQLHYPGTNYLGPGTHIRDNLENGLLWTSPTDFKAMQHDVAYLGSDHNLADNNFISDPKLVEPPSWQRFVGNAGIYLNKGLRNFNMDFSRNP